MDKAVSETSGYGSKPKQGAETRAAGANATADRALDVLLCFSDRAPIWSAADLATNLQMPRSTLYRYLTSLRACNMIVEDQNGGFRLGPRILELARTARRSTSVLELAVPRMRVLEERYGEIIILKERVGWDIANLELLSGHHRITLTPTRSQILPWPAAPSAKLFAAFCEPAEWEELQRLMRPVAFTPQTVASRRALKAQLSVIREQGYAVAVAELNEGVGGLAVPIFERGRCRYSISLAAPLFRLDERALHEVAVAFRAAAEEITAELEDLATAT